MDRCQELLTKTVMHLRQQGERCYQPVDDEDNKVAGCRYRLVKDGKTLMCAAGPHIPDDKYNIGMEGEDISFVNRTYELGYSPSEVALLTTLQRIHDNVKPSSWEERWLAVANEWNLTMPEKTP